MSKRHQSQLFITVDSLVSATHPYRKLDDLLCFRTLNNHPRTIKLEEEPKYEVHYKIDFVSNDKSSWSL